jgi:hypothetical protein
MKKTVAKQFPWLKNVDFYITTECNRNCRDCMAYDIRQEGIRHMESGLFSSAMDSLYGIDSVHLAGIGEPFLHPDFFKFLNYASKRANEVRINTNGQLLLPLYERDDEAEKFAARFPRNTGIYWSVDSYHEKGMPHAGLTRMVVSHFMPGVPLTYSVRVLDKEKEEEAICRRLKIGAPSITNRVLKMGNGKNMKSSRYVDLFKLLKNHVDKPMIGILHDGTVVSNFIAAYLPKSNRPRILELGNLNETPLSKILKDYDKARRTLDIKGGRAISSMIDDMKSYPFIVVNPGLSYWHPDLKKRVDEVMENTAAEIARCLDEFRSPRILTSEHDFRLISDGAGLRYHVEPHALSKKQIEDIRNFYRDMFVRDVKIGGKRVVQESVSSSNILKLCILHDSEFLDMGIPHDSPRFWQSLLRNLGLPEDEWKIYLTRLILGDRLPTANHRYLSKLGIDSSSF